MKRGRPVGTKNRRTLAQIEALQAIGLTPLEYLASVYADPAMPTMVRLAAAKAAAPFVHARLARVEVDSRMTSQSVVEMTTAELYEIVRGRVTEGG